MKETMSTCRPMTAVSVVQDRDLDLLSIAPEFVLCELERLKTLTMSRAFVSKKQLSGMIDNQYKTDGEIMYGQSPLREWADMITSSTQGD